MMGPTNIALWSENQHSTQGSTLHSIQGSSPTVLKAPPSTVLKVPALFEDREIVNNCRLEETPLVVAV